MKKVVVISTSLRPGSNRRSATLWSQQPRYGGANSHAMVEPTATLWWSQQPRYGGANSHAMVEPTATLWWSQQPRYGGANSHALAEQFAKGAQAAGHQVELISLHGKELRFCVGCLSCQQTGACVFKDDVPAIMESVLNADIVCWATPIYYYEMSGQMKTLIDRMCFGPRPCGANAMYPNVATSESKASELALPSQSNVTEGKDYRFRDIYLLTTAAEDEPFVPQRA